MKLRQLFYEKGSLYDLEIDPKECVKIADNFAVDFLRWTSKYCYLIMNSDDVFYVSDSEKYTDAYTIEELLEIYKDIHCL